MHQKYEDIRRCWLWIGSHPNLDGRVYNSGRWHSSDRSTRNVLSLLGKLVFRCTEKKKKKQRRRNAEGLMKAGEEGRRNAHSEGTLNLTQFGLYFLSNDSGGEGGL